MIKLILRSVASVAAVAVVTWLWSRVLPVNATTACIAYLLLILAIASTWGFIEAALASFAATFTFNLFFLPPVGALTIADPQNWVALFSFLATALIASRLSAVAESRAAEAVARRHDLEHLYSFSRAILLIESGEPFRKQLAQRLAEIFGLDAVVLYDRRTEEFARGGPAEFDGVEEQLRDAARHGTFFTDPEQQRVIAAVRLGSEPIAALALQGARMPDSVLQGIANLVAIGLERAAAQDLAHQVEAARRSDQLRTTLLDAIAHEFKTPLTSIKAVTTSLIDNPDQPAEARAELLAIADEEAERMKNLIDRTLEMARLDSEEIALDRQPVDLPELVREALAVLRGLVECREVSLASDPALPPVSVDRRLLRLAIQQILDNALKYSPPRTPVAIRLERADGVAAVEITDRGPGIRLQEQGHIFDRFYRGEATRKKIPGSGLGLSIARSIVQAHGGWVSVASQPGETTFRIALPLESKGVEN